MASSDATKVFVKCLVCNEDITDEEKWFKCYFCENATHYGCSALKSAEIKFLEKCSNVIWQCDECVTQHKPQSKFDILLSLSKNCMEEIQSLKIQINAQNEIINKLTFSNCKIISENTQPATSAPSITNTVKTVGYAENTIKNIKNITNTVQAVGHAENTVNNKINTGAVNKTSSQPIKKSARLHRTRLASSNDKTDVETKITDSRELVNTLQAHDSDVISCEQGAEIQNKTDFKLIENDGFELPKRKTRKPRSITNIVGVNNTSNSLQAAPRKAWYFLGRLKPNTESTEIIDYLNKKMPDTDIQCEKLISQGVNSCFKVGVDFEGREKIEDPNFWPIGVILRRYIFRKRASTKNVT